MKVGENWRFIGIYAMNLQVYFVLTFIVHQK